MDLGGTNIAAGVVDAEFKLFGVMSIKTNAPRSAESICGDIVKLCKNVAENAGIPFEDIKAIGIASPGIIRDGYVYAAVNLGFDGVNVKYLVEKGTGKPVSICNDANAAALAECLAGSGKGHRSLVAVTIGTGIGGGIIIDNKIVDGFNGAGAEIGHIVTVPDGRLCACGNRGCIEAYCSASALVRSAREVMMESKDTLLWEICPNVDEVNGEAVFEAVKRGDPDAKRLLDSFVKYLSVAVANIIILLQPNVLCIGGGMSAQEDALIKPLINQVNQMGLIKNLAEKTLITAAKLHNDAGIIGAAADVMGVN